MYMLNYNTSPQNFRLKSNRFGLWWNSIDRVSVAIIFIIAIFSLVSVTTASPFVANRIGVGHFYFIKRQAVYLTIGMASMIFLSCLSINTIKRLAVIGFFFLLIVLALMPFIGFEAKGAKRWVSILGKFSFQPSEFVKPFFIVLTAWIFSMKYEEKNFPSFTISFLLYLVFVALLIIQPDFGMAMLVSVIWIGQLFIAGLSMLWFFALSTFTIVTILCSYIFLPHVKRRIDSFLNPESFENYQIKKSLEAFKQGGFYGTGPGEGVVKQYIPDSHADFIFSVIGEEMGFITCVFLVAAFFILIVRGLYLVIKSSNNFNILAVSGILMQLGVQSAFNMGMTLHLLPTKGMTLPLISYGGSSVISTSIALGMMLSFTRKRYDVITLPTRNFKVNIR